MASVAFPMQKVAGLEVLPGPLGTTEAASLRSLWPPATSFLSERVTRTSWYYCSIEAASIRFLLYTDTPKKFLVWKRYRYLVLHEPLRPHFLCFYGLPLKVSGLEDMNLQQDWVTLRTCGKIGEESNCWDFSFSLVNASMFFPPGINFTSNTF